MRLKSLGSHLVTLHNLLLGGLSGYLIFAAIDDYRNPHSWPCGMYAMQEMIKMLAFFAPLTLFLLGSSAVLLTRLRGRAALAVNLQIVSAVFLNSLMIFAWSEKTTNDSLIPYMIVTILGAASIGCAGYVYRKYRTGQLDR